MTVHFLFIFSQVLPISRDSSSAQKLLACCSCDNISRNYHCLFALCGALLSCSISLTANEIFRSPRMEFLDPDYSLAVCGLPDRSSMARTCLSDGMSSDRRDRREGKRGKWEVTDS